MMRFAVSVLTFLAFLLAAAGAQAKSCSSFVIIKNFDAEKSMVKVSYERGNEKRFFPKTEGANTDTTKIPTRCKKRTTSKHPDLVVKPTGGRMNVTQIRSNFYGTMLNKGHLEDPAWLPAQLEKLATDKTEVMAIMRPGRKDDDPPVLTTIYLPITDEEKAEIARLNAQAEEVDGE